MNDKMNMPPITAEEQELADRQMIQHDYDLLLEDYRNSGHNLNYDLVDKAFQFANKAHAGVRRRSGEPYMLHPLAVARIVVKEIGLGTTSICAALLHDVVEDTDYTVEDLQNIFGERIAKIVDGLTKISGGVFGTHASSQAENFRKLLLTISEDIRVIMIKIADRLHNMRTLSSMPENKQLKIAGETLYLYAPFAHRLGLFRIKSELEELAFKYQNPKIYSDIQNRLLAGSKQRDDLFGCFIDPIKKALDEKGYEYQVQQRIKTVYSIWHKMQTKNVPFEEIYDIMAVRIIYKCKDDIDEKAQAWMIYSAITNLYRPHPDRLRDWVSSPKANGYEALHTTVMGPDGHWVEVQIRSERMHEIAEKGISAHWKYKEGKGGTETELDKWLKTIKDILDNPEPSSLDFLDTFKLNLFSNEIFVFTPKGDIKTMPQGATALDFAFMLHSDLGLTCIGAKVNHKLVPLSNKLESGDQVEVLTSKKQKPKREWLDYTTTASAKSKLKAYFRKEDRAVMAVGKEALEELFKSKNITLDDQALQLVMNHFNFRFRNDLYYEIGNKVIRLDNLIDEIFTNKKKKKGIMGYLSAMVPNPLKMMKKKPETKFQSSLADSEAVANATATSETNMHPEEFDPSVAGFNTTAAGVDENLPVIDKKKVLHLIDDKKLNKVPYQVADCCKPIPGDNVIAFIDEGGRSVTLHKRNCPLANKLKANFGERIVQADWKSMNSASFPVILQIQGVDVMGVLLQLVSTFTNSDVDVDEIHSISRDGMFDCKIRVLVHNIEVVNELTNELLKIKPVQSVHRLDDVRI